MTSNQDIEQLRLLAIFHYVVGGIIALFSLIPIVHVVIGLAIVTGAFDVPDQGEPPPEFVGWMFVIIGSVVILCGLTIATCVIIAGRRLARQTNYTYCLVVAAIECTFMPFGTVLGVFTIIVLMRPTVKTAFGVPEPVHVE